MKWYKPYIVDKTDEGYGIFKPSMWSVVFEDSPLFKNLYEEQAKLICAALNGAYNLGRESTKHYPLENT